MSDVRTEVVRLPDGEYRVRTIGDDGPPLARPRPGALGIKWKAGERRTYDRAIQAGLKAMYERQQAQAS